MIEWGNHWAQGLKFRQENNEAVCGFFSHIGNLHQCHHLWAYRDLQSRKETRDSAWQRPGWDENVRYTGESALIQHSTISVIKSAVKYYSIMQLPSLGVC